ncbi:MAG: hypothetical protein ACHQ4J_10910 [Candidatus Binatia bacterium]
MRRRIDISLRLYPLFEIRAAIAVAALTLTLSRAGDGTGEGSWFSIAFAQTQIIITLSSAVCRLFLTPPLPRRQRSYE